MKSKLIAVSAISSAICAIVLTIGTLVNFVDLFCLVISSVFVMIPLYYKSYKASFLSFLASGILAFIFTGFNITLVVVPAFLLFFGSFPLVKEIVKEKKVNKILFYILGMIWCVGAVYGIYFYYVEIMGITFNDLPRIIQENIYIFIGVLGVIFYNVYDRYVLTLGNFLDRYLRRILK